MNPLRRQQGFTLVEVITVMLVLVAIATITVESSKDFVFQNRYEVTKDRYEKIKKAIIGDANQVINGQPNIEGFVKDVGRLPFALQELLDGHFCSDTRYFTQASCEGATPPQIWAITPNWKKPYIAATKVFDDINAISDGWGNTGAGNYGWEVSFIKDNAGTPTTIIAEAVGMNIQSKGKNGSINIADSNYDEDYPKAMALPSIKKTDWMVDINSIQVSFKTLLKGSCSVSTCSDPIYITKASCETPRAIWDSGTLKCSNTFYTNQIDCETSRGTWSTIPTTSKLNCEAGGAQWTSNQKNICLKLIRNFTPYFFRSSINEDGREHIIPFLNSNMVSMGDIIGLVLDDTDTDTDCNTNTPSTSYSLANQSSICVDTLNSASFTKNNCEANHGVFIDDGTKKYCDGVIGSICTDTTGINLGGTGHPKFKITLTPNTTLSTINW